MKSNAPPSPGTEGRLRLLVIGRTRMDTIRLPSSGEVRIGRSPACAVVLAEPSIAEEHALLRIGRRIILVDLGSGQPTAIGQEKLEPGAESRAPMAVVVIGGLLSSTLLAIFVTPALYTLLDDLQNKVFRRKAVPEMALERVPAPVAEGPVAVPVGAAVTSAAGHGNGHAAANGNGEGSFVNEPAWLRRLRSGDFGD